MLARLWPEIFDSFWRLPAQMLSRQGNAQNIDTLKDNSAITGTRGYSQSTIFLLKHSSDWKMQVRKLHAAKLHK